MKTSIKLGLKRSKRTPETGKLQIFITNRRITRTILTSYELSPDEWDETEKEIIIAENASVKRKKELALIKANLHKDLQLIRKMQDMLKTKGDYSTQELVNNFRNKQQGQMFCEYINRKSENLRKSNRFGTAHTYRYAAGSLLKFLDGRDIRIDKITSGLIKSYEHYLFAENKSKNTVSCYIRSLRAVYNQALVEKIYDTKKSRTNPFIGVFTGYSKTQKRAISVENILKLQEVKGRYRELQEVQSLNPSILQSLNPSIPRPLNP